jgi:t-SNARE complex subunit (syntaxin)
MGFSRERAYLDQIISGLTAGSEEYRHLKEVRELAQEARERYIVENPEATVQEINQMILDNIIRPEFLAHDGLIGEERS